MGTHTVRLAVRIDGGRNLGSHLLPAGHSGGAQAAVVAGQSRGKAEPPWAELLRCVHPGEQVPRGPEKGGQGGVQRGADLWARQGRWKDEGGGLTRREKTCKAAAVRDDDPGGLRAWRQLNP